MTQSEMVAMTPDRYRTLIARGVPAAAALKRVASARQMPVPALVGELIHRHGITDDAALNALFAQYMGA